MEKVSGCVKPQGKLVTCVYTLQGVGIFIFLIYYLLLLLAPTPFESEYHPTGGMGAMFIFVFVFLAAGFAGGFFFIVAGLGLHKGVRWAKNLAIALSLLSILLWGSLLLERLIDVQPLLIVASLAFIGVNLVGIYLLERRIF